MNLPLAILTAAVLVALAVLYHSSFELHGAAGSPAVWRVNRLTGSVQLCVPGNAAEPRCIDAKEGK